MSLPGLPPGTYPEDDDAQRAASAAADANAARWIATARREVEAGRADALMVADEQIGLARTEADQIARELAAIASEQIAQSQIAASTVQTSHDAIADRSLKQAKATLSAGLTDHGAAGGYVPGFGHPYQAELAAGTPSPELARYVGGDIGAVAQTMIDGDTAAGQETGETPYNVGSPPPPATVPPPPASVGQPTGGILVNDPIDCELLDKQMFSYGDQSNAWWRANLGIEVGDTADWLPGSGGTVRRANDTTGGRVGWWGVSGMQRSAGRTPPIPATDRPQPDAIWRVGDPGVPACPYYGWWEWPYKGAVSPPPPSPPPPGPPPPSPPSPPSPCPPVVVNCCNCGGSPPPPPPPPNCPPPCQPVPAGTSWIMSHGTLTEWTAADAQWYVDTHPEHTGTPTRDESRRATVYTWEVPYPVTVGVGDAEVTCPPSPPECPPSPPGGPPAPLGPAVPEPPPPPPAYPPNTPQVPSLELSGLCAWFTSLTTTDAQPSTGTEFEGLARWVNSLVDDAAGKLPLPLRLPGLPVQAGIELVNYLIGTTADRTMSVLGSPVLPLAGATISSATALTIGGFLDQWFGVPTNYLMQPIRYAMQYSYPTQLPTQADADSVFLSNRITEETWTCWTRSLGNMPDTTRMARDAGRARPNIGETIAWTKRKEWDESVILDELRNLGVTDKAEGQRWLDLFWQLPPLSDLIRFMVRDTENPEAVRRGRLDDGFSENWQGQLAAWGRQQGIGDDYARREWRAHWQLPSPTQLYQMLRRLRPGRVPADLVTRLDDVVAVLKQNDMAPGFVDRLAAISYDPITRTDLIKGFNAGEVPKEELTERLQDVGYNEADAKYLVKVLTAQRKRQLITTTGGWTPRAVMTAYREGTLTKEDADKYLREYVDDDDLVGSLLDQADSMRAAAATRLCIAGVKSRFMYGEFDSRAAVGLVTDLGVDTRQAQTLVRGWECSRASRRKQPAVAMLQKWWMRALINDQDARDRLGRLGYTQAIIDVMMQYWQAMLSDKQQADRKKAERAEKAAQKEAEREREKAAPCRPRPKRYCGPGPQPASTR